jgi:polysaccharide biosynthesis protein PslJ
MSTIPIPEPVQARLRVRSRVDAVTLLSCYVFLIMIIPAWLVFSPFEGVGQPSTIFAVIVFAWYLVTWLHPGTAPAAARQPVRLGIIVFSCAVIAAYVSANRTAMTQTMIDGADRGAISLAGWAGVLLLAADGIDSLDRLRSLLRRVVLCATAMAALAIAQFFTGLNAVEYLTIPGLVSWNNTTTDVLSRDQLNRVAATTLHPIELAVVLAMVLPFAIHQARYSLPERRLWHWLQVVLIGAALPLTISKTAVVAAAAVAMVLLPSWSKRDRLIGCAVIAAAGLITWEGIPSLFRAFRSLISGAAASSSTASRTDAFSSAAAFIARHPWLGMGFGTFNPQIYFYTDDQYLLSLIEIGAIGLLALMILFASGWMSARRARRASADPETRDLAQCLAATIAVSITSFATFDALTFPVAAGLTFFMIGCAGAMLRLVRSPASVRLGSEPRV